MLVRYHPDGTRRLHSEPAREGTATVLGRMPHQDQVSPVSGRYFQDGVEDVAGGDFKVGRRQQSRYVSREFGAASRIEIVAHVQACDLCRTENAAYHRRVAEQVPVRVAARQCDQNTSKRRHATIVVLFSGDGAPRLFYPRRDGSWSWRFWSMRA